MSTPVFHILATHVYSYETSILKGLDLKINQKDRARSLTSAIPSSFKTQSLLHLI